MRTSILVGLAAVNLAVIPSFALGGDAQVVMTLNISTNPSNEAETILLSRQLGDVTLASGPHDEPLSKDVVVDTPTVERSSLTVVWKDNSTTSFPLRLSKVFGGRTVEFFFQKTSATTPLESAAELDALCAPERPTAIRAAFLQMARCKEASRLLDQSAHWTPLHRSALNRWLIANTFLYNRMTPVGPFAYDEDLLATLGEIVAEVDAGRKQANVFLPLRIPDARAALAAVKEEGVRLAGFLPELTAAGRIADAQALNDYAISKFDSAVSDTGKSSVAGISMNTLIQNGAFFRTLSISRPEM